MDVSKDVRNAPETPASSSDQQTSTPEIKTVEVDGNEMPVNYGSFNKLVGQVKKTKELNQQLNERLAQFDRLEQQREETKLADKVEYQKLIDLKEQKINELASKLESSQGETLDANNTLTNAKKLSAVYEKLPGKLRNNKFLEWIDVDSIVMNPENGDIDAESASLVANKFMDEFGYAVDTSHIGRLPGNASSQTQALNHTFKDLPLKDMRKNMAEAVRLARKEKGI